MKTSVKVGQIYKCRDERRGKRWVRIDRIKASYRFSETSGYYLPAYAHVSVRRGRSRKWIQSDRTIRLDRFSDGKGDYRLVEK